MERVRKLYGFFKWLVSQKMISCVTPNSKKTFFFCLQKRIGPFSISRDGIDDVIFVRDWIEPFSFSSHASESIQILDRKFNFVFSFHKKKTHTTNF